MLQKVRTTPKKIDAYKDIIDPELFEEIIHLSKKLKRKKILHINATRFGGGVAEILYSLIPLLRNVGVDAQWQTIAADERLFEITKAFHNAFQGESFEITKKVERTYKRFNAFNAHVLEGDWDIIVVHDPQPAAIPYYLPESNMKFIWRCHIDTSTPNKNMWKLFKPFLAEYDAGIFTLKSYVPPSLPIKNVYFEPPAIDPLVPKNKPVSRKMAKEIVESYGIDAGKPLITQISRFDPWKDPVGVIKAYQIAKKKFPDLQLALVGSMADDDPEGWVIYKEVEKMARKDKSVFMLTNIGNIEVNAFQVASDVVIQKSTREGFGLTVTEAMWKGSPVIGGKAGGIKLQIENGLNGFLVGNIKECAKKIVWLLENPAKAKIMAQEGKATARRDYLIPRLLRDELKIYNEVLYGKPMLSTTEKVKKVLDSISR